MSRFGEVDDQYDPATLEERVFEYWDAVDAYEQTVEHRADGEPYFFVDGPPYTSGSAHLGTTWNKALKDVYLRYLRMTGHHVTDRPGYDMHGLPIETKVEEELGFDNKKDIEEFGEDSFIEACKEFADENLEAMQEDFKSFGVWMDWEDPYKTVDPEYMEAAWWGFAQAADRGLVERGERSISWCPRCETGLANNEVEYATVEDPSIYVKFDISEADQREPADDVSGDLARTDGSIVIWTTTPWTIPANTFVAVDEDGEYVGVRAEKDGDEELLYVAEAKLEAVLQDGRYDDYEVVEELSGADLIGWEYDHPLAAEVPDHVDQEGALTVYAGEYVETDGDGTGLVHSAPGHGEEDFRRGNELGFDAFCPVGDDGTFTEAAGKYADQYVKDADEAIIDDLAANGALLAADTISHSYGYCWRCDTDILQVVTDQWFITITDVKDDLLDNIEDSEWYPDWARDNRFRDFVEDAPDWNVSRQRYWGIPIPIWTPEDWAGEMDDVIVIGTREELADRVDQTVDPETVDLHKDTVDELTITEDGRTYTRVDDVFDVWLDSAVATWGTIGFPGDEAAFEEHWPADLILEAHDQTRGWFWSQLGMGTAAMDEIPYERVLMHGHALDENGRKMSKSVGNVVEPDEAIERHGADAMRLFLLSATPQGDDMRFSWDGMATMANHLRTLWNVFRFPLPYMRLDDFDPSETTVGGAEPRSADSRATEPRDVADDLELIDEWVLARLQSTKAEMTDAMEAFRQDKALDALIEFVVEDVSRYYVQVVRERMWEEDESPSKLAAYATLYRVLEETVVLLAPFAPFITEEIYGTLTGDEGHPTVHMADWPEAEDALADEQLEADVALLRSIEEAGANARQQAGRSLRWPVPRVVVAADDDAVVDSVDRHRDLLAERLNARAVELVAPDERWGELNYSAEADMSELGPAFGGRAGEVMQALNDARIDDPSLDALTDAVDDVLEADDTLTDEMVSFVTETPDGVAGTAFGRDGDDLGVVYVDASLTDDIESEGYAREVIRRVQEMRKDLDLDVEEEIALELSIDDDRVADLVSERADLVETEVRAAERQSLADGHRETWELEDVTLEIAIEPVATAEAVE